MQLIMSWTESHGNSTRDPPPSGAVQWYRFKLLPLRSWVRSRLSSEFNCRICMCQLHGLPASGITVMVKKYIIRPRCVHSRVKMDHCICSLFFFWEWPKGRIRPKGWNKKPPVTQSDKTYESDVLNALFPLE